MPFRKKTDLVSFQYFYGAIAEFERSKGISLSGIAQEDRRRAFCFQIVESMRRTRYIRAIAGRGSCSRRTCPHSDLFDPERAIVFYRNEGNLEEALWLTFLTIHFGKNKKNGWKTLQTFYKGDGEKTWTLSNVRRDYSYFEYWYKKSWSSLNFGFSNHRKYESLNPDSKKGTLAVVNSFLKYLDCVGDFFEYAALKSAGDKFDFLYRDFSKILRFGRLAKFEMVSLLHNMNLVDAEANSMYLSGATGPLKGAKLLLLDDPLGDISLDKLDAFSVEFTKYIGIGMQPLEDALCNWQKAPISFLAFRG